MSSDPQPPPTPPAPADGEPVPAVPVLEYGTVGPVRMTAVATYGDAFEAHLARAKLEAEGIPAFVDGENVAGAGVHAGGIIKLTVQVAAADAPRAREVLDQIVASRDARGGSRGTCPHCRGTRCAPVGVRRRLTWVLLVATVVLLVFDGTRPLAALAGVIGLYLLVTPEHNRHACPDCGAHFRPSDPREEEDEDEDIVVDDDPGERSSR
jgi:hypothetical protein